MILRLSEIDFRTPEFVTHHYFVAGCIAIITNFFVVYLLLFHSRKMDNFKYYLLTFQISCTLVDIHLSFLMQPIPLFPIRAGYSVGILSIRFQTPTHFLMAILAFLVGLQVNCLTICFLRKHQAISNIGSKCLLPRRVYNGLGFYFLVFSFSFTLSFYFSKLSKTEQWWIIDNDYHIFRTQFENLYNFEVYKPNAEFIATLLFIAMGCSQSIFTVSLLLIHMLKTLSRCSTNLSKSTLNKHKTALRSLVAQFLTTPIGILPGLFIVLPLFVYFENAQVFSWFMLMVMTTHSTINSLVLIFTLPEFRAVVLFCSVCKRHKRKSHFHISFMQNGVESRRPVSFT